MKINHTMQEGTLTVMLYGEMDHHSAKEVREEVDRLITEQKPVCLRLDLSRIAFCDSSGLGFIMGRYKKITTLGGSIVVQNPSNAVFRIMSIAGMDKLIKVEYEVAK